MSRFGAASCFVARSDTAHLPGMPFLGQLVWRSYLEWGHRRQLGCELVMEMLRVERS